MESNTPDDKTTLVSFDALFMLLKNQAKEFETFGKRMSSDIQNSYKVYLQERTQNELAKTFELDEILEKQKDQLVFQSNLINSLKSRIKELESDSIKKNHEIKRLKKEFLNFKQEVKSLLELERSSQSLEGNDSDDYEFIHSGKDNVQPAGSTDTTENTLSNEKEGLIAENNQSNKPDIKKERLVFQHVQPKVFYGINGTLSTSSKGQTTKGNGTVIENKDTPIHNRSVSLDEPFSRGVDPTFADRGGSSTCVNPPKHEYDVNGVTDQDKVDEGKSPSEGKSDQPRFKIPPIKGHHVEEESSQESLSDDQSEEELEEDIKYNPLERLLKRPSQDPNQNSKTANKLRDLLLDLKTSESETKKHNLNDSQDAFNYVTRTSTSQQKAINICLPPITIDQVVTSTSSSQDKVPSRSRKKSALIEQIEEEVQSIINQFREKNAKIKQKTFNYLLNQFTLDSLIKYQGTAYYNSLAKDPKRSIKLVVKTALRNELCIKEKRVTQPIEEYVKRKIIPPLPIGIQSYADYEKTSSFDTLSDEKKRRIRKIITIEPKH